MGTTGTANPGPGPGPKHYQLIPFLWCSSVFGTTEKEVAEEEKEEKKMIYRKWSLLTGPVAILAAIAVPVTIINYIIVKDVSISHSQQNSKP